MYLEKDLITKSCFSLYKIVTGTNPNLVKVTGRFPRGQTIYTISSDLTFPPLMTSSGSTTLPRDLDIFSPFSLTAKPWTTRDLHTNTHTHTMQKCVYCTCWVSVAKNVVLKQIFVHRNAKLLSQKSGCLSFCCFSLDSSLVLASGT